MTNATIPQTVRFPDLFDKPLVATFDREQASSDGGAVLLKAAERVYGLVKAFARCLVDERAPEKIRHTLEDLVGQRVFGIACGHPDGNDADHLADDPIHKLLLGRDPVAGGRLASQPTISRFENDAGRSALYRMGRELAASVIERHRRRLGGRARRITIDLDPTDDRTHGAQQLTFFNSYYDSWCYLPLLAFVRFDREVEQYLCAAVLRPGKAVAADGTLGVLSRLLPLLRCAFPRARLLVRLDGGFATPEIFDFLDAEPRLDYVVAMAKNAVLLRHAASALVEARAKSAHDDQTAHVYTDTRCYRAGTWDHERRVVIKAEVVRLAGREPRDNPRFVVTNLRQTPRFIYEKIYCARGDIENRIKELLDGLQIDRTSCCKFWANQLRVFLTSAALSAASSCICRGRRHTSMLGATSPSPLARAPGSLSSCRLPAKSHSRSHAPQPAALSLPRAAGTPSPCHGGSTTPQPAADTVRRLRSSDNQTPPVTDSTASRIMQARVLTTPPARVEQRWVGGCCGIFTMPIRVRLSGARPPRPSSGYFEWHRQRSCQPCYSSTGRRSRSDS